MNKGETRTFNSDNFGAYTVEATGIYKLEAWGGAGETIGKHWSDNGGANWYWTYAYGGSGGYAKGYYKLKKGQTIYINKLSGGSGKYAHWGGGWGADGHSARGGACAYVSLTEDVFSTKDEAKMLIMAGGGGGGAMATYWNSDDACTCQIPSAYGNGGAGGTGGNNGTFGYGSACSADKGGPGGGAGYRGGNGGSASSGTGGSGGTSFVDNLISFDGDDPSTASGISSSVKVVLTLMKKSTVKFGDIDIDTIHPGDKEVDSIYLGDREV